MDSFFTTHSLNVSNDPFSMSLPSFDPTTTFFDPFASSDWPWAIGPKLEPTWAVPTQPPPVALSQTQLDAFKYELASPVPSPCDFFFEIEPDTTNYETCYDEFMENKLSVLEELVEKAKATSVEEPLPIPPPEASTPVVSLESLFEGAFTLPDTFMDDFWQEAITASKHIIESPSPSTSSSASTFTSVVTPPSSTFSFSHSSETEDMNSLLDQWEKDMESASIDDNPKDGDYEPFQIRNQSPVARRKNFKQQQHQQPSTNMDNLAEPFPNVQAAAPKAKPKRKALQSDLPRDSKRQKVDHEVVCRINGCRHISKTRFECFKHRETHFPGRFQCPHPACRKIFVRSSSLSRHLKRPRNAECGSFSGGPSNWGVGLVNFALHPPAWLAPGFLDEITDV
ncbi:hypothetical protein D9615_005717 [Tricholomella constricta]|uniref:C2H2-type domain-containing protein n=1 Tax=Tricholomella constricta TaxID=117010 RepID=A0A8H5M3V0_9AGAR|nr:hypothetical protein D9615_005717 [Tricholomella constricta]